MKRDLTSVAQINGTTHCEARTRAGAPCRAPAMSNGKCRLHGGLSPGPPCGAANGRYVDGYWTIEAIEERKFIRLLVKGTLGNKL
ncbi:HGGxSTG domain-containing protein [Bradyrhizobium sp. AUGA SZCCT0169]|uniref:HGGxSTG domain-containing protein n=1 Tax=Bradyrhizobium sp. AUGA SZCCT0169 TaxID=2807663 RepID=UPI0024C0D105|nr:HGGxSTG domain-containing protein [Bradyrhizobium sp. AUGA SZCCT0169]